MAAKKLLVADDSLTIQKVIRLALQNEGYEIHAVSDGNDAVQQIALFQPQVVLIDVSLPGQSAFEVKRAINESGDGADIRFVLMSSAFEKVDEPQAESLQFHGRLTKPFDPANLREILNQVLTQPGTRRQEAQPVSLPKRPASMEPSLSLARDPAPGPSGAPGMPGVDDPMDPTLVSDSDIKHLTESTIKMSGLDDYEWNVQEPSLKPQPDMQDAGESSFALDTEPPSLERESETRVPTEPEDSLPEDSFPADDAPPADISQLDLSPGNSPAAASYFDAPENTADNLPGGKFPPPLPPRRAPEPPLSSAARPPSEAEIEALIQRKVEETVQRMARELLPQVAERILKQEIHRLLSERP